MDLLKCKSVTKKKEKKATYTKEKKHNKCTYNTPLTLKSVHGKCCFGELLKHP